MVFNVDVVLPIEMNVFEAAAATVPTRAVESSREYHRAYNCALATVRQRHAGHTNSVESFPETERQKKGEIFHITVCIEQCNTVTWGQSTRWRKTILTKLAP